MIYQCFCKEEMPPMQKYTCTQKQEVKSIGQLPR